MALNSFDLAAFFTLAVDFGETIKQNHERFQRTRGSKSTQEFLTISLPGLDYFCKRLRELFPPGSDTDSERDYMDKILSSTCSVQACRALLALDKALRMYETDSVAQLSLESLSKSKKKTLVEKTIEDLLDGFPLVCLRIGISEIWRAMGFPDRERVKHLLPQAVAIWPSTDSHHYKGTRLIRGSRVENQWPDDVMAAALSSHGHCVYFDGRLRFDDATHTVYLDDVATRVNHVPAYNAFHFVAKGEGQVVLTPDIQANVSASAGRVDVMFKKHLHELHKLLKSKKGHGGGYAIVLPPK
jgi:hypothetical protein